MRINLKPLSEQVLVITGASSGIGLTTARMAAKKGARLVLVARNEPALRALEQELTSDGAQAVAVVADVGNEQDVNRVADTAISRFGGFDTWINNAGVSIYGRFSQIDLNDARRMFDTDFWGVVHGSRAAVNHFKDRTAGALINIGSTVSDRAIPLQSFYVASKHAVKGFTDAIRMEVEEAQLPISVTLIKPAAINTPFTQHARNYMENEPDFPPPVYAPQTVARSILHAATHPVRDIMVGAAAKTFNVAEKFLPRTADRYMEKTMFAQQQKRNRPRDRRPDGLFRPGEGLMQDGDYQGHVMRTSAYTAASLHPFAALALLGLAGVAAAAAFLAATDRGEQMRDEYLNV